MEHVLPESLRWLVAAPIYAVAYTAAVLVFRWMAKRRDFDDVETAQLALAGLIGGLLGATIIQFLVAGEFGKTIEGGIAGGWLAVIIAKRMLRISRPTGDLFALAIPVGEAIGRIACFIGGCCYGKVWNGPWAVFDHGAYRHPTQLYLSVLALACAVILYGVERKNLFANGGLFLIGGMLFCIDRFIVEFYREGATMFGTLTVAQYGCMAGFVVFAGLSMRYLRKSASART